MRKVAPSVTAGAVIFADCAPLTFAQIGPPQIPVAGLPQARVEPTETVDPLPFGFCHGGVEVSSLDQGLSAVALVRLYIALSAADSASFIAAAAKLMASIA